MDCVGLCAAAGRTTWRELPADGTEMTRMVDEFRRLFNEIRPHETLNGDRPLERYLTAPAEGPSALDRWRGVV